VGAAVTAATFTGIELRPGLVGVARDAARRLGLATARFVQADVLAAPLHRYQAFYVCNPFAEAEAGPDEWLDADLPAPDRAGSAARLADRLATLPPGTRVAIHCGLGAPLPPGFELVGSQPIGRRGAPLEFWVRGSTEREPVRGV
jgi:hypothetical protein